MNYSLMLLALPLCRVIRISCFSFMLNFWMKSLGKRYGINISRWHWPPVKHRETSRWCESRSWEKWSLFGIRTWRNTPYLLYFCTYTMTLVLYFSSAKAVSPKLENEIGNIFWSPLKLYTTSSSLLGDLVLESSSNKLALLFGLRFLQCRLHTRITGKFKLNMNMNKKNPKHLL